MTYIAPRTEALARAMCVALGEKPDEKIPRIAGGDDSWHARWRTCRFLAEQFINLHSIPGELPEREGEGWNDELCKDC